MVRATRVANPLSRALGAGIGIGAIVAALFMMTNHDAPKAGADMTVTPSVTKVAATS